MLTDKQKIIAAIDQMTDIELQNLCAIIVTNDYNRTNWSDIPIEEPTESDKLILDEIYDDDDFIPQEEVLKRLGISKLEVGI
ncbi:MAG: hypothetical protein FWG64_14025 [Firmicutes bacterium]|nr:hypothetical protein [Bacillota bacterium]